MIESIEVEDNLFEENDNSPKDSLFNSNIPTLSASSGDDNGSKSSSEDENSSSDDEDGEKIISSGSDSETETEDKNEVLMPLLKVKWKKCIIGEHAPLVYEGPISQDAIISTKKGMANTEFFPENPNPLQCFFDCIPISFFDNVAKWTENNLKDKKVTVYEEVHIQQNKILGMIALWFIFSLVSLPSTDMYYNVSIPNILSLLSIEIRDVQNLPKILMYNQLASLVQWNDPVLIEARLHTYGRADPLYSIRPLLSIIQEAFPQAWIPSVELTVDELLLWFKGRTFVKRFMKEKTMKYGFLE